MKTEQPLRHPDSALFVFDSQVLAQAQSQAAVAA